MYKNESGDKPVADFMDKAPPKVKKKFQFMLEYIKNDKKVLCEPYVKHFTIEKYRRFYELRLRVGVMVRIIYILSVDEENENIILLHAFYKYKKRDTEQALDYALKLAENIGSVKKSEYLEEMKKE